MYNTDNKVSPFSEGVLFFFLFFFFGGVWQQLASLMTPAGQKPHIYHYFYFLFVPDFLPLSNTQYAKYNYHKELVLELIQGQDEALVQVLYWFLGLNCTEQTTK